MNTYVDFFIISNNSNEETAFTCKIGKKIKYKEERPALIISSTSWTGKPQ